jgi:hypothetical protein
MMEHMQEVCVAFASAVCQCLLALPQILRRFEQFGFVYLSILNRLDTNSSEYNMWRETKKEYLYFLKIHQ